MFKAYKDISDVVSLLVYCPTERSYLLTKEASGEYWIPSSVTEKNSWKLTAQKINFELFGMDAGLKCLPLRVYKVWLPNHHQQCIYHAVYKVPVKADVKKRTKTKSGPRNRLVWLTSLELERARAHNSLRSPEVAVFSQLAMGDQLRDTDFPEIESGSLIEICEENVMISADVAGGAVAVAAPNCQLLHSANYTTDGQVRMYREFLLMVYPALYMSPHVFTQFMLDVGWQKTQCPSLFRSADVTGRGGLSFLELMLWTAAVEPCTQHSGIPAEIRCRYIFRYYDSNKDLKLEYEELKELVAAARGARQLPADGLSVARDADLCLRQLELQPNSQLSLPEFLRSVGERRLRGTSSLLRAPRSLTAYLLDLQERDREVNQINAASTSKVPPQAGGIPKSGSAAGAGRPAYRLATHTVRLRRKPPHELLALDKFGEDALSPSTADLLGGGSTTSFDVLGPNSVPMEALAAVHYFATAIEKPSHHRRVSNGTTVPQGKPAFAWATPAEEAALGSLLLRLAEAVKPICLNESRLLQVTSPVYVIGDLHGNLAALLALEAALWGAGGACGGARVLLLGDYVDRGALGAEVVALLLAAKLQRPRALLLLRGNHETRDVQKMFTFHNECISKYGQTEGNKIWNAVNDVFDVLPLAAIVDDKVFCCHGGIPPPWACALAAGIARVPAPLPRPPAASAAAWALLWNDPVRPEKMTASLALELAANEGFACNARRGTGHVFDGGALQRFLRANGLTHVLRAHELQPQGFKCQMGGRLVSLFSSYRYCGGTNDAGAALLADGKIRLLRISAAAD